MDELVGKLNRMNQMAAARIENQINETAKAVRKSARARVPVLTGGLKRSIKIRRAKDRLSAVIGPQGKNAWRAHFTEFGTVNQSAQPYMAPAWEENKNGYMSGMKKALGKAVDES